MEISIMKSGSRRIVGIVSAFCFLSLVFCIPAFTSAQTAYPNPIDPINSIPALVDGLANSIKPIVITLSAISILIGAFLYVTAGGDEKKIKTAHAALTYGVLGIIIMLSASTISETLKSFGDQAKGKSPQEFLDFIINLFGTLIMAISVFAILYAAFLYITSGGDTTKVFQANRLILYAVVGIAIAVLAKIIPKALETLLPSAGSGPISNQISTLAGRIAQAFGTIVMAASVLAVLYASFLFVTVTEDSDRATTARRVLLYALIGVAVGLLAYIIPNVILKFAQSL
ncbi:MAG: hypothetical protein HY220_02270 [Candidatus Sungbacteria bacterium]|uniref:Uncharacterized protein n=1 Tax=Candidatus Sungiibacteriota bacterium TaxID=2750080 RepID=A0A9D6LRT4_9BACT|nr:hypothetical protein [Candidatus Sungbacteria bacterium]